MRVNDEVITVEDVLEPLMPAVIEGAAALAPQQQRRYVAQKVQAELLAQVQNVLLYQEASKDVTDQMIQVLDRYVDQEIKDRVNREFGGRQTRFEAHLASMGMTIGDARDKVRRRIIIVKYLQDNILHKICDPTRRELLDYYYANIDSYTQPASRELFLIDIPKGDDAEGARAAIQRARSRLAEGEDFELVARGLSRGIHAAEGGQWGHVKSPLQGRYTQASTIFFELGEDQISDIVETADAFFIVKAGEVIQARTRVFAEVQPELVERYRNAQFEILRRERVRILLEKSAIEPREDLFLRAVVDSAMEQLAHSTKR